MSIRHALRAARRAAALSLLTVAAAPQLAAQVPVEVVGRVLKEAGPPACNQATHRLACSDIWLYAAQNVDLSKVEGQLVEVKGTLQIGQCALIEVNETPAFSNTMTISPAGGGAFRIGENITFRMRAPLLSIVPLLIADSPGFLPLGPYGHIGLGGIVIWANTGVALLGSASWTTRIPMDTTLVGVTFYSQGVYLTVGTSGFTGRFANTDCFKVQAAK